MGADLEDGLLLPCKMYHIHDYHCDSSSAGEQANMYSLHGAVFAKLPTASRLLIEKGESIYSVVSGLCVLSNVHCCIPRFVSLVVLDKLTFVCLTDRVGIF